MMKEWYKDWFSSDYYLDVYKHRNFEDTESLTNLILSNIEIPENSKILDAACGAGRYSIKFAEKGYKVTGFDLSPTLLEIAKNEASERNYEISFIKEDIRNFKTNVKFDLVLNLFTSFGYFDKDEENFTFPKNAFNFLKEKSYFVLDFLNKDYLLNNLVQDSSKSIEGTKVVESRFIENGRVIKKITIGENEDSKVYFESVKLYSCEDLITNFSGIGYKVKNIFGNYLGETFNNNSSERCIIFFQK